MKNKITLTIALAVAGIAQAQVGFNTQKPNATLDVVAKSTTGATPEGLLVPRVDRLKAQTMTGVTTSTMIYVNSIANGSTGGTAANINSVGYYYFDGTAWIKINTGTSADTNIYNQNGSLTGNRVVNQVGNTLAFTSTATTGTSHFSVDGTTLNVDAVNNRVGIGTQAPNNILDLGTSAGKKLAIWNSTAGDDFYGFGAAQNVLQFFAGVPTVGNALMTLNKNGNVGVGTTSPQTNFHTIGTRRFENATAGTVPVGSVLVATDANGTAEWQSPRTETTIGNLGSGYDIPFTKLTDFRYTGSSIALPPGKWIVTVTLLVRPQGGTLAADDWLFVRSTFSDQNLTTIGQVGVQSANVIRPTYMSFQVAGPYTGGQKFNVVTGTIQINNTTAASKTYRYIVGNTEVSKTVAGVTISTVGGGWSENSIVATAIN